MNDLTNEDDEEEDAKPKAVASIQGKGLPKPMGTKKAKKMKLLSKMEQDLVASVANTEAIMAVAQSAQNLNKSFDKKQHIDSLHKSVDSYIKIGMTAKALELLDKIQELLA